MNNDRDLLVFTDDNGQEIQMEVVDYFDYEDQEYALLVEAGDHDDEECGCGCGCDEDGCDEKDVYIMKVVIDGDMEEFLPVEEEKMDELIEAIEELYEEDEDEDEDEAADEEDEEE